GLSRSPEPSMTLAQATARGAVHHSVTPLSPALATVPSGAGEHLRCHAAAQKKEDVNVCSKHRSRPRRVGGRLQLERRHREASGCRLPPHGSTVRADETGG